MARSSIYPPSVQPGKPRLGEVPPGWKTYRFADLFEVIERPAILRDDEEYQLITAKRSRGGVVARERLLGKDILTKTQFYVAEDDFVISNRQIVHGGCGIVPAALDGAIVSNEYTVLRPKPVLLLEYLRYLPHTIYFQQTCFHASVGVDVEKMVFDLDQWLTFKIHMPMIDRQQTISELMNSFDAQGDACDMYISRQKIMKSVFADKIIRFSGGSNFREVALSDVVAVNPESLGSKTPSDFKFRYIDIGSVSGELNICNLKRYRFEDAPSRARKIVRKGDILVSTVRPYLRAFCLIKEDESDLIASTGFAVLRPDRNAVDQNFLFQQIMLDSFVNHLIPKMKGSNYPAVSTEDVSSYRVMLPPLDIQRDVARVLSGFDVAISSAQAYMTHLRNVMAGAIAKFMSPSAR